jgi:hypothetical protein
MEAGAASMKNVAICSLMRAGATYERAYYLQILALSRRGFNIQSVNIVYDQEPTGADWLRELLRRQGIPVRYEIERGRPRHFERFEDRTRQWAEACNECIELALSRGEGLTHLAWVEADLSYPYDTMELLLARDKPIISPLVYLNNLFYDRWAFRHKDGSNIHAFPETNPASGAEPIELASVGSFVVFDVAVFRANVRFRAGFERGLLVGVCEDAAKLGFKSFADPTITILHPVSAWLDQVWPCRRTQVFVDGVLRWDEPMPAGSVFAGPYEEHVRPWLNEYLQRTCGSLGAGRVSIARDPAEKSFDIRVDFDTGRP